MSIKRFIKKVVPPKIFGALRDLVYPEKINILEERLNTVFFNQHQNIASPSLNQKIAFKNAEFKVFSKHGGDGILAYIFSKITANSRTFVEMGVEDATECNTTNLAFNFGWNGLLVDANDEWVKAAKNFYEKNLGSSRGNVKMVVSFVTAENINKTIQDSGITGEIDLLSIDIDSNDYWIWDAVSVIKPRVVVVEYNSALGLKSLAIKYNPRFYYQETFRDNPLYFGASLTALTKLAHKKGYILVGCDTHGHDAFFVKSGVARGKFIEMKPEEVFYPNPHTLKVFGSLEKQFEGIKHLDFDEIQ